MPGAEALHGRAEEGQQGRAEGEVEHQREGHEHQQRGAARQGLGRHVVAGTEPFHQIGLEPGDLRGLRLPHGVLHRLEGGEGGELEAAEDRGEQQRGRRGEGRDPQRPPEQDGVVGLPAGVLAGGTAPEEVVRADAGHEERRRHRRPARDVAEGEQRAGVGQDGAGVGQLDAVVGLGVTDGVVEEAVGDQDPVRRQVRGAGDDPEQGAVDARAEAVPAEDPQAQEGGLHEERDDRLHRQRGAEDVPRVVPEPAPGQPELELHDDAGDDPDGVVDDVELPPEAHHALVQGALPAPSPQHRPRLDRGDEGRQAQRQRDEQEVCGGGEGELPPGEVERFGTVHAPTVGPRFGPARRPAVVDRGTAPVAVGRGDVPRGLRPDVPRP